MAAGALLAGGYIFRLATRSPDVTWNRKTNPEPWNEYTNKQYKVHTLVSYPKRICGL